MPFTAVLFVLPLPGSRRLLAGYRWPVLAVQAVLTWVPFAVFGGRRVTGLGGLLAGLVLLMLAGRASWLLAGLLVAADVVVRAMVTGLEFAPVWSGGGVGGCHLHRRWPVVLRGGLAGADHRGGGSGAEAVSGSGCRA